MSSQSPSKVSRRKRISRSTQKRKASALRPRRGSVTFLKEAAVIPEDGGLPGRQELREGEEEGEEEAPRRWWPFFRVFLENSYFRLFFRISAFVNILSLILSAPFVGCSDEDGRCDSLFAWFVTITCVDFLVSVVYTVQAITRIEYAVYLYKKNRPKSFLTQSDRVESSVSSYVSWYRLANITLVTLALWWSVAIGVLRSVEAYNGDTISSYFYLPFTVRILAVFTIVKLFLNEEVPLSVKELWKNIKWKQLFYVTLFYIFFIYIYALMGVQWVGGLSHRCVYVDSEVDNGMPHLAIPLTHCNPYIDEIDNQCYSRNSNSSGLFCEEFPNGSRPLNVDFRNEAYFGQFRVIIDAMFAVYEASSLELWSFMLYTAYDGAPSSLEVVNLYYLSMVFYLVIFVQQSIFLVVIIESFADLRSAQAIGTAPKPKDKPLIVLTEQTSSTDLNDRLTLQTQKAQESVRFTKTLNKWYNRRVERVFLILVAIDAVITSLRYSDMSYEFALGLQIWQVFVSFLFLCEIVGVVAFHLFSTNQFALLFKNPYYWYLGVVAIGGLVSAITHLALHVDDPQHVATGLAVFQAARLPRLIRLSTTFHNFFFKIIGDGKKLLVIMLLTGVFLVLFAVISMQLFGYLEPKSQCSVVGMGQFDNFFLAMQAMFQLIMQEGWSELMSEVMCHRPEWFLINLYFILLHLFASLILLNFFVAVILDNLDYDEEKKVEKLQQVVNKKITRKVPFYLKLLTACGPKLISAPKISSAGIEVPNLTEADVKNFYESGEARDVTTHPTFVTETPIFSQSSSSTLQRQTSDLSKLQLLSEDSEISSVSSHHEKYQVIQGILNSVKAFRQQNKEQEGRRPGLEGGGTYDYRTTQEASLLAEDEYDLYRAKYRLFDSALFCMPPDHRLRKLCKLILTKQMSEPSLIKVRLTPLNFIKRVVSYYGRYTVSRLPYFTWVMLGITLVAIVVLLEELKTDSVDVSDKNQPVYIWLADLLFIVFTLVELILKILANGFFLNPDAAIRSPWDVIDWVVVLSSLATMITYMATCGTGLYQTVVFTHLPWWLQIILGLRLLRPLRTISLVPQMRRVIWDVVLGWKKFLLGGVLLLVSIFMFASLGVQLFAGKDPEGPQAFCNDPSKSSLVACLNNSIVSLRVTPSRELLPNVDLSPSIMVPTVWYRHRRDFNFDNTAFAMLTMFEVLTLEGWLDVRDMLQREDPTKPGIPTTQEAWYMAIFLHIFIFFGVNIGLQLFVGIVVNNFNAHKPGNSALLTVSQKRWTDLIQRISLLRPIKRPPEPSHSKCRLFLYRIVISHKFRHFSTAMIIINSFCFVIPWNTVQRSLKTHTMALMILVIFFFVYFVFELCVKILAFGPKGFFNSWRNIVDSLLSLLGVCYVIWAVVVLASGTTQTVRSLGDFALVLTVLKCFTILGKYSIMQNLSITVIRTLIGSIPLLAVMFCILFSYAFIGNLIFSNLRTGEGINLSRVNFDGPFISFLIVIRVMTGEDWHHLLRDAMIGGHYCSNLDGNCGNVAAAIIWFLSYYVLITFILLNIVIAVLLENFSIFYNEDDTNLSHVVIKDFKQNWLCFDKGAQGTIPASRIKLFLRTLRLQDYYTYGLCEDNGLKLKVRHKVSSLTDPLVLREMAEELQRGPRSGGGGGRVELVKQLSEDLEERVEGDHSFHSVVKMLAYRAEDISQRLEPQELYERQEFEESVQFDVAEECILKWIKRFVQPVVDRQEEERATEHNVRRHHVPPRMDSLWATEPDQTVDLTPLSGDTDDEMESDMSLVLSQNPYLRRKWLGSPSLPTSEDLPEPPPEAGDSQQSREEQLISESYSKLAQISLAPFMPGAGAGRADQWHEWFRMQRNWSQQVESANQNYFDDHL